MSVDIFCETCGGSGIGGTGDPYSTCANCHGNGGIPARDARGRFVSGAQTGLAYTLMQDAWAIAQPMSFSRALAYIRGSA